MVVSFVLSAYDYQVLSFFSLREKLQCNPLGEIADYFYGISGNPGL
jgi:hypothetical protein